MKNRFIILISLILVLSICFVGCGEVPVETKPSVTEDNSYDDFNNEDIEAPSQDEDIKDNGNEITLENIPEYSGEFFVVINNNIPYFEESEISLQVFENYSELDSLGRCGVAYANLCKELMPTEKRESISEVKPSGWNNKPYDFVDGRYIYNRCHLIGFQLAGENANELNLITGTRSMNVQGMLPFENMVADYIKETGNHVLYRITPIYDGNNLVADGVLMEAYSVEDDGEICFNVFCYNVEPGCVIDYATGDNWLDDKNANIGNNESPDESVDSEVNTYIVNTNSKKFHNPECPSADKISSKNKKEISASREDMIKQGYSPCGQCKP